MADVKISDLSAVSSVTDAAELEVNDSGTSRKASFTQVGAWVWSKLGALINGGTAKTTPVDADQFPFADSAASNATKKVTWANIKATLATYFSTITRSVNAQTGTSYTLVLGDAGKLVTLSNASAITLNIPANSSVAFETNTQIDLLPIGAGAVTIDPGTGVTLNGGTANITMGDQYKGGTLLKIGSDTWVYSGPEA